jgi:sigma-B regulation protein RsbU (phosphoserine phosphatase)
MPTWETVTGTPRRLTTPLQLVCSEVWGGNRLIDAPVELPGVRGKIYSRPCAGGRGGDVHYLSVCNSGLISHMCVADVVGHGAAVATVSGEIHGLLRRYIDSLDQRKILRKLNHRLVQVGLKALTTAAAVTYFPPRRRLSISYAGHPPAWFYRQTEGRWGQVTADAEGRYRDQAVNLPLALDTDTAFTRETFKVSYGDRLLLLTDGVLETPSRRDQLFGDERLKDLLNEHRKASAAEIAEATTAALFAWGGDGGLSHDDVTLLVVEFVPGLPGPAIWHVIKNRIVRPRGNSADPAFADPR